MDGSDPAKAPLPVRVRPRPRRVSDQLSIAFHLACDQNDLEVADRLLAILEFMLRRPSPAGQLERRVDAQPLVAGHQRLWDLRHPEARTGTPPSNNARFSSVSRSPANLAYRSANRW
jgi:hypothetical protein